MRSTRAAKLALIGLALVFAVAHVAAVFTESINWDELVLFQRAEHANGTGELRGGGRPGLGVIALTPIVRDCATTIGTVDGTRLVWVGLTFALFGGLFWFLRDATRRDPAAWHAAALGTALVALVPVVLRWSLHVRTDQPALACAVWSGVALLASRRRRGLALIAGLLLGTGYLFSQKAIYVGALVGLVAVGDATVDGKPAWRDGLVRLAGLAGGLIVPIVAYRLIIPHFYAPVTTSLEQGLDQFDWYRRAIGFRVYVGMLPTLVPQLALLALVVVAALRAGRRRSPQARPLLVALCVILLGIAVGWFHAAAFPYFWLTLGLYPATSIAIGWAGIRELLPRGHFALAGAAWLALVGRAIPAQLDTLVDTQRIQRDSFAFIDRNFTLDQRGFQIEGGLFCRRDPDPLPTFLGQSMLRFEGEAGARTAAAFVEEFRRRPIAFMITGQRLNFPGTVTAFWAATYVPYRAAVSIAGHRFSGAPGSRPPLEIVVPGVYRWFADGRIAIDGHALERGQTVTLATGSHAIALVDPVANGMLALAVDDPPDPSPVPFDADHPLLESMGL